MTPEFREVKTFMNHVFIHCHKVRIGPSVIYYSSRLQVVAWTELIHINSLPGLPSALLWNGCWMVSFWLLPSITSYTLLASSFHRVQLHSPERVVDTDLRFICVLVGRGTARGRIPLLWERCCYQSCPAILAALIRNYASLVHLRLLAVCVHGLYCQCNINIIKHMIMVSKIKFYSFSFETPSLKVLQVLPRIYLKLKI